MKNLFILLVVSFSLVWASCTTTKGLKFQKIENLTVLKDRKYPFLVYVKLYNPNKFPLEIKYGNVETFLEDLPLGEIKYDTVIKVGGKQTFLLPLGYNPNYRSMFPDPEKELAQPSLNIKIDGSIAVEHRSKFYITAVHFQGDMPQSR